MRPGHFLTLSCKKSYVLGHFLVVLCCVKNCEGHFSRFLLRKKKNNIRFRLRNSFIRSIFHFTLRVIVIFHRGIVRVIVIQTKCHCSCRLRNCIHGQRPGSEGMCCYQMTHSLPYSPNECSFCILCSAIHKWSIVRYYK